MGHGRRGLICRARAHRAGLSSSLLKPICFTVRSRKLPRTRIAGHVIHDTGLLLKTYKGSPDDAIEPEWIQQQVLRSKVTTRLLLVDCYNTLMLY